jgi:hypothetical protein
MTDPPPDDRPRRSFARPVVLVGLGVAVLAAVGLGLTAYLRWRADRRDMEAIGRLQPAIAIHNHRPTDAEFDELLALTVSREAEVRMTALALAGVSAYRHKDTDRQARVVPVAARLLADPDPGTRRTAINLLGTLGAKEHLDAIRPFLQSADRREREAAEKAVARLEGKLPKEEP